MHNPPRPLRESLDDLPFPDLTLIGNHEKISPTPFLTSRGCPFDCEFCSVIEMFGRGCARSSRPRSHRRHPGGAAEGIFFYDDNFIISKRSAKALLAADDPRRADRAVLGPDHGWIRSCRGGRVDHELLPLLREAGCYLVYLGLESVESRDPGRFQQDSRPSPTSRAAWRLCTSTASRPHGMFVFGSDADTLETLRETADFAIEHELSSVQFMLLTPLPGTRQTAALEREGRIFTRNWSLYDGHHVVFWPKHMSPLELQDASIRAHQRFYRLRRCACHARATGPWASSSATGGSGCRTTWPTCGSCARSAPPMTPAGSLIAARPHRAIARRTARLVAPGRRYRRRREQRRVWPEHVETPIQLRVVPTLGPRRGRTQGREALAQVLALANQKGGVAKTTTTLNLGVAFVEMGYRCWSSTWTRRATSP